MLGFVPLSGEYIHIDLIDTKYTGLACPLSGAVLDNMMSVKVVRTYCPLRRTDRRRAVRIPARILLPPGAFNPEVVALAG